MNKNTGDGELREQLEEFAMHMKPGTTKGKHRTAIFDTLELTKLVQHLIAQEANKAQQQLLQGLMEQAKGKAVGYPCVPLKVIQNKLEGLQ